MNMNKYLYELRELLLTEGENEEDIQAACIYAQNLLSLGLPVIFNREHFALLVGQRKNDLDKILCLIESHFYSKVVIPKKSGGVRTLQVPAVSLREIQKWILDNILAKIPISSEAMGFCKARSIVTNANVHLGQECIVNIDLKDFFPTITQEQVYKVFYYYGYTVGVSYMLSKLCTFEERLPQGAPTSPYLSNIVCLKLDKRLSTMALRYNARYSRYADDITFSSDHDISTIVKAAIEIIEDEGFFINDKKTRVQFKHQRQEVTGLLVNGRKVRVEKSYIKKIKQEIFYCKKYGVDDHLKHIGCSKRFYQEHIYGKAYFVNMVDNELGKRLITELNSINWE